jgi:hypothetical protein
MTLYLSGVVHAYCQRQFFIYHYRISGTVYALSWWGFRDKSKAIFKNQQVTERACSRTYRLQEGS